MCLLRKIRILASVMERLCWSLQDSTSAEIIADCLICQGHFSLVFEGKSEIERIPVFLVGDYLFGQALYISAGELRINYGTWQTLNEVKQDQTVTIINLVLIRQVSCSLTVVWGH